MKVQTALKRLIVGRPMSSGELGHTLLPKTIALPVFASDALSSMSYATQEILLVLAVVSVAALSLVVPIALAVSLLLAIVIVSYRQIVRAYPGGGGAYVVAHENLGLYPGLVVAGALLIDYVLTVAVSITAGADALVSAFPAAAPNKLAITIGLVGLVTLANLRGSKESGKLFALPTYGFVVSIYALIITGLVRCVGGCPQAESSGMELEAGSALTAFLVLRAFSAGTTALTGVEAIAEGVPVFRWPQSRNAATTLSILGVLSISMFLGVSWLADHTNVVYTEESARTMVAQVAHAVFGGGLFFYIVQAMTALILVLAANTAYTGFPVLTSILAKDHIMPRQFRNRGDRLVFSNGIVILALFASLLVYAFDANLNRLIQLYLVGVFLSFTLAQFGTVVRWRRTREPGWKKSALINAVGASVTGVVLIVVVSTKFLSGAWIVLAALPVLMFLMRSIRRHYDDLEIQLENPERVPAEHRPGHQHMVILVDRVDEAAVRAAAYAHAANPADISAVTFDPANLARWSALDTDIPLSRIEAQGSRARAIRDHLRQRRSQLRADDFLTLMVPEVLRSTGIIEIFRRPGLHRLKASLLRERGVQVLDIPVTGRSNAGGAWSDRSAPDLLKQPARHLVVVLVSNVHNATLQAIEYAETLQAAEIRAVSFVLDQETSGALGTEWLEADIPHPLEIEDSPFRDIGRSMCNYLHQFEPDGINRLVTVVIPEFVVQKRRHQFLHGQTALILKRHLLFEPGVVTVSVPFHLEEGPATGR
ncbi:APC family permease [soil metagenome]